MTAITCSWKILVSGFLPEYLYETGRLENRIAFSELQQQALINELANAADHRPDFSVRIRREYQLTP